MQCLGDILNPGDEANHCLAAIQIHRVWSDQFLGDTPLIFGAETGALI